MATVIALFVAVSASAGSLSPDVATASDPRCARAIAKAITASTAVDVPAACWRIGPLQLGMTQADVEHRIGKPVADADIADDSTTRHRRYHATLYVFPTNRWKLSLLELRYGSGHLVAIDNAPGGGIFYNRCIASGRGNWIPPIDIVMMSGPLAHFGRVGVGNRLPALRRTFGQTPSTNRSRDWYSYMPIPISFGVNTNDDTINGIAIATDFDALSNAAQHMLDARLDPATCRPLDVKYSLRANDREPSPRSPIVKAYRIAPPIAR